MSSMKVNLHGLLSRARASCTKANKTFGAMNAYALEELEEHIVGLCRGKYTLNEFAEHYCIERDAKAKEESEAQ
jgi:hypothetical protein